MTRRERIAQRERKEENRLREKKKQPDIDIETEKFLDSLIRARKGRAAARVHEICYTSYQWSV